ncbi:TDE2712 family protein [Facklamia miroungae]|uniref:Uncharacterized protein n=1 Tax=Facklamia miroungae TaxID=120956 RepID=A0A1G7QRI1_9LACT|nr:hypothetical protein [Facklamia miroungae]NKZ29038.1 hypothetical protein [Facklamia miroungae]SDG01127.1 hypothetical protein SAMN05421791_102190 [Facklamia miroungae]
MLKTIKINFETIELMDFYWQTAARREKLADTYLLDIANRPEMEAVYTDGFDQNSVRKVLSAVINYEPVNEATEKELEFYQSNKFFADDPGNVELTLPTVKTLNVDALKEAFSGETKYEEVNIHFVPSYNMVDKIDNSTLTINFFKLGVDFSDFETVLIEGQPLKEYIQNKLSEML